MEPANQTVAVQFVDREKKVRFEPVQLPSNQLPESFEARTTMHIAGDNWEVVEARPMTAVEFCRTGKLQLLIQKVKIVTVPTKDLLYSLPTITEHLPDIAPGTSKLQKDVLTLNPDDWRQVEWVSAVYRSEIAAELSEIVRIREEQRVGHGFKSIHVRKSIPTPFESPAPTLAELQSALGDRIKTLDGTGFYDTAGLIENGFSVRLFSSIELYGQANDQQLLLAGFFTTKTNNVPQPDVDRLADFAAEHQLLLVDWRKARVIEPNEAGYRAYFIET